MDSRPRRVTGRRKISRVTKQAVRAALWEKTQLRRHIVTSAIGLRLVTDNAANR